MVACVNGCNKASFKKTIMKLFHFSAFILLLFLFAFTVKLPAITITGKVTDEQGNGLSNISVSLKNKRQGTQTDAIGHYSITVPAINQTLVFSGVGYDVLEIKTEKNTTLNVVLKTVGNVLLEDVVVTGYEMQRKRMITGAAVAMPNNNYSVGDESWRYNKNYNREGYDNLKENPFLKVTDNPLSTFSIDVDGASYSNIRRFINEGRLPPQGAVRIEEMINYFQYDYPQPNGDAPFSINTAYVTCPWNRQHQLVSIGLQGKKIATENLPAANIVFLIDVSGSMQSYNKLPLVQSSMLLLADQLRPQDKVSIVVYAGRAGLVLPASGGDDKFRIKKAISGLQAGGSTAGGEGIKLAYKMVLENFIKNGNNRIVLCTDGDFNVGVSSDDELERLIEEKRKSGVFLTVLGFGTGNYQDAKMQKLADKGNGNHAYIDNISEAKKVLINQFGGTLFTIAKDVKLQVEFNPATVQGYRLIGYENRMLAKEDFNNDKKDAGELGSGHTVTALYEIIPTGIDARELHTVDDLKYQKPVKAKPGTFNANEVMTVKFRYKKPDGDKSLLLEKIIYGQAVNFNNADNNMVLAAAVAQLGMNLKNSEFKGDGNYRWILKTLKQRNGLLNDAYKKELFGLVEAASKINNKEDIVFYEDEIR